MQFEVERKDEGRGHGNTWGGDLLLRSLAYFLDPLFTDA